MENRSIHRLIRSFLEIRSISSEKGLSTGAILVIGVFGILLIGCSIWAFAHFRSLRMIEYYGKVTPFTITRKEVNYRNDLRHDDEYYFHITRRDGTDASIRVPDYLYLSKKRGDQVELATDEAEQSFYFPEELGSSPIYLYGSIGGTLLGLGSIVFSIKKWRDNDTF